MYVRMDQRSLCNLYLEVGIDGFECSARLLHLTLFRTMCSSVLMQGDIAKCMWQGSGVYVDDTEFIPITVVKFIQC